MEVLVTLLVVNILILMLSNILVITLRISLEINERSAAREEMSDTLNRMKRDIRNANIISEDCLGLSGGGTCSVEKSGESVIWDTITADGVTQIRRRSDTGSGYQTNFITGDKLNYTTLLFQDTGGGAFTGPSGASKASILITMTADHTQENIEITNLYRQVVISTRNYSY